MRDDDLPEGLRAEQRAAQLTGDAQRAQQSEARLGGLAEQLKQHQEVVRSLESKAAAAAEAHRQAETKVADLAQRLTATQQRADQAERRCRLPEDQHASAGAGGDNRAAERARLEAEVRGARRRIAELEAEINRIRAEAKPPPAEPPTAPKP